VVSYTEKNYAYTYASKQNIPENISTGAGRNA
jgi:hypothetical protein